MTSKLDRAYKVHDISREMTRLALRPATIERATFEMVAEARVLADAMHAMTGVDPDPKADGMATVIGDMLAHLMRLAHADGVDFDAALESAHTHFTAEQNGE